jgi:hypothetical protein
MRGHSGQDPGEQHMEIYRGGGSQIPFACADFEWAGSDDNARQKQFVCIFRRCPPNSIWLGRVKALLLQWK